MLIEAAPAVAASAHAVQVRPATEEDLPALHEFVSAYYGPRSNQANPRRIEWLFRSNPLSQGLARGLTLAVVGNRVVGSHWKMRLPWKIGFDRMTVPSPHDLALLEPFRKAEGSHAAVPPGLQLALGVLHRERHAALLGLSPASESIYSRFQCQRVPMVRMQRILSPARTAAGMLAGICGLRRHLPCMVVNEGWRVDGRRAHLTGNPVDSAITTALSLPYRGECRMDWDLATYRWRFFHPLGPKHFLLTLSEAGEIVGRAAFSHGLRRGATLSRLVDVAVASHAHYPAILAAVDQALRRLHVAVATVATTCEPAWRILESRGWRLQHGVESRFYIRPTRRLDFSDLWGGSYDYGFDAVSH